MTIYQYKQLSPKEQEAFCILGDLNGETLWHIHIAYAILDGGLLEFRKLLWDIRNLPLIKRYAMKHIIGYKALKAVLETENIHPQTITDNEKQ